MEGTLEDIQSKVKRFLESKPEIDKGIAKLQDYFQVQQMIDDIIVRDANVNTLTEEDLEKVKSFLRGQDAMLMLARKRIDF